MIKAWAAMRLRASPTTLRSVLNYGALTILMYVVARAVVELPAGRSIALIGGSLGVLIWLLYPEISIYALVLLCPFTYTFKLGPLNELRPQDALLAVMAVTACATALAGRRETNFLRGETPKVVFVLWAFLIVWGSVAYLEGPSNQWLLKDPIRNTWYLYKSVWRDLLTFVVVALFLRERHPTGQMLNALQIVAVVASLMGIWQTITTGQRAYGPFEFQPNQLAAFLILIIPYAMTRLLLESGWKRRLLLGAGVLVMLRAIWFTGSRGGFIACIVSFWPLALMLPRRKLLAAGAVGLIGILLLFATVPDLMNRPVVQRYLTLTRPDELQTFEWRKEQWRHFMSRIAERPWLGTGSSIDGTIDKQSRLQTAHNAYLGFALRSGWPVSIAWICILVLAGAVAIHRGLASGQVDERVFWIGTIGFTTALSVHAMNETALLTSSIQQLFWIIMAFAVVHSLPRRPDASPDDAAMPDPACR